MTLSELFEKNQKHIDYKLTDEFIGINKYRLKLDNLRPYHHFIDTTDTFFLILGYAITNAIKNKEYIEELTTNLINKSISEKNYIDKIDIVSKLHDAIIKSALPYFISEGVEYYVPIFSRALNAIYSNEQYKLNDTPFNSLIKDYEASLIDLFEVYNFTLFDSTFTRLVKIKQVDNVTAFYHADFRTIYFINEQGRLDYKICLFDKYLKKINTNHIAERVLKVADAYFKKDQALMIKELIDNSLISEKLIYRVYPNKNKKKHL